MYLGLDIGTTSVCAVVLDKNGSTVYTATLPNTFGREEGVMRMQDAEGIYALCEGIYREVYEKFRPVSIGVSGQMHGILYLDRDGNAVSPLFSWQDGRGNLPYRDGTYASVLSAKTGYAMASGFGGTTLFYDTAEHRLPPAAVTLATIGDYVAMRLARRRTPLLNNTCAASVGLFDIKRGAWDERAILSAGLSPALFPAVTAEVAPLGQTVDGVTVYTAIGDNQASVYGAVKDHDSFLVNVGTGSQISVITDTFVRPPVGEVRPFLHGAFLVAGCPLCGGYSYRLLKQFFESVTGAPVDYALLNRWASEAKREDAPTVLPQFRGTRSDPSARAVITGLSEYNFNAGALTLGLLRGISAELHAFYTAFVPLLGKRTRLVGAGNAVRQNPVLREIIEEDYALPLAIPAHKEEAAFGAALAAAETYEGRRLKEFIRYQK